MRWTLATRWTRGNRSGRCGPLERFARDADDPHLEPWRRFVRDVGSSGDVGIWHETFRVKVSDIETIYTNMPTSGLAKSTGGPVPVAAKGHSAARRIGHRAADDVAVEPS